MVYKLASEVLVSAAYQFSRVLYINGLNLLKVI